MVCRTGVALAILAAGVLAGCGGPPPPRFVVIEHKDPAFTVFTPAPPGATEILLRRMVAESAGDDTTRVVAWDGLPAAVADEIGRVVVRQDFPGVKLGPGLVCLMTKAPGPWGVTANGGLAVTRNDYEVARRSFAGEAAGGAGSAIDPRRHLAAFDCP